MDALCSVCNEAFDDSENVFECDGCCDSFHIKCGGVKKADSKARQTSTCLRIYCKVCVASPETCAAENLKTILKVVFKIDHFNSKQVETNIKVNDILSSTVEKVNEINEKLESLGTPELKQKSTQLLLLSLKKSKQAKKLSMTFVPK